MKESRKLNIHQIFWYFVLFSILGLIIETLYSYITTGILESRKGFIWGPFCPIYGVGVTCLILLLDRIHSKNYFKLFIYGYLIGSIVEYMLSFMMEAFYGVRFWDYTYTKIHINGRICLIYSLFWGILTIGIMKFVKPQMDKFVYKISSFKISKHVEVCLAIFLMIDMLVTIWGISTYETRVISTYYGDSTPYKNTSSLFYKIENNYFTNERMKKTFQNLRTKDRNGNQVFVRDLIK